MIMQVDRQLFSREFQDLRPNDYSRGALNAMFDYFEELGDDLGEEIEFDVISICCNYTEYKDLKAFQDDYGTEYARLGEIKDVTTVIEIPCTTGFVIQNF